MFPVRPNKFFYKLSVFVFSYLLFGFFVGGVAFAQTISRAVPTPQEIVIPGDTVVSGSCPAFPDLENHISICGIAKTIDINVKDGVQYAQEPIKGATVAAYLGVKYSNLGSLSKDPNGTGELVGLIERLYTYDITNADGRFVLPVPRGAGTNGFIFLGFFCGNMLKDLYMIDTSQDLPYMPVSLACPPEVIPAAVNAIPAPPSINYADRTNFVSCEDGVNGVGGFVEGEPGMIKEAPKTVNIPLQAAALDNTRIGARVTQTMEYQCRKVVDSVGHCQAPSNCTKCSNPSGTTCLTQYISQPCPDDECYWVYGSLHYELVDGSVKPVGDPVFHSDPIGGGHMLEVPKDSPILSRRDLEGFTHTSMGYSFQTISSLNCGISGCYNTGGPSAGHTTNQYLDQTMVEICNTQPFPPLNCKGPGIELAEPREWTRSYDLQKQVEVYPNVKLGDITLPQYSAIGQLIQDILAKLTAQFPELTFTADDASSVSNAESAVQAFIDKFTAEQGPLAGFKDAWAHFNEFLTATKTILGSTSVLDFMSNVWTNGLTVITQGPAAVITFGQAVTQASTDALRAFNPGVDQLLNEWDSVKGDLGGIITDFFATCKDVWDDKLDPPAALAHATTYFNSALVHAYDVVANAFSIVSQLSDAIINFIDHLEGIVKALGTTMLELKDLHLTTVSKDLFPYSTVLNYDINKNFREAYLNRPINDSYWNLPPNTSICKNTTEQARQVPSSVASAAYPFNACYGSFLLGEDTYSTQKALYLTTKNTPKNLTGKANDPVVSKFLAPKEPVGAEVSPKTDALDVTPVTDTPKVGGKGYWRLGVVQTMCSHGQIDYDSYKNANYVDYPVLGAYGAEGNLRATPAY